MQESQADHLQKLVSEGDQASDDNDLKGAAIHYAEAVKIAADIGHENTLDIRDRWAEILHQDKKYNEAIRCNRESLRIREGSSSIGDNDESTMMTHLDLADNYAAIDFHRPAMRHSQKALEITRATKGPVEICQRANKCAVFHFKLGGRLRKDFIIAEAVNISNGALRDAEKALGKGHLQVSTCRYNRGCEFYQLGRRSKDIDKLKEAHTCLKETIRILEAKSSLRKDESTILEDSSKTLRKCETELHELEQRAERELQKKQQAQKELLEKERLERESLEEEDRRHEEERLEKIREEEERFERERRRKQRLERERLRQERFRQEQREKEQLEKHRRERNRQQRNHDEQESKHLLPSKEGAEIRSRSFSQSSSKSEAAGEHSFTQQKGSASKGVPKRSKSVSPTSSCSPSILPGHRALSKTSSRPLKINSSPSSSTERANANRQGDQHWKKAQDSPKKPSDFEKPMNLPGAWIDDIPTIVEPGENHNKPPRRTRSNESMKSTATQKSSSKHRRSSSTSTPTTADAQTSRGGRMLSAGNVG